jgi:tetratricopeptide (TPR) repeat protein
MRSMAEKALQLDPLLAETHDAYGLVYARSAQWQQAESSFRQALALDPNNSSTYLHYALWYLHVLGRNQEGVDLLEHAAQLDPLADDIRAALGELLISVEKFRDAEKQCSMLAPANLVKVRCLARVHIAQGKTGEAAELLEKMPELPTLPLSRGVLGYAYASPHQSSLRCWLPKWRRAGR